MYSELTKHEDVIYTFVIKLNVKLFVCLISNTLVETDACASRASSCDEKIKQSVLYR